MIFLFSQVTNDKDPLIYISTPRSQPRGGFHLVDVADTIVSVTKTGVIGCHSWLPYDKHSYRSFVFDVDSSHTNTKYVFFLLSMSFNVAYFFF